MLHIVIFQAIIAPIIVESMMNMAIQSAQIRETGQVIPKRTPPNTPNIVATAIFSSRYPPHALINII